MGNVYVHFNIYIYTRALRYNYPHEHNACRAIQRVVNTLGMKVPVSTIDRISMRSYQPFNLIRSLRD